MLKASSIQTEIEDYLSKNRNRWYQAKDIATALDRKGKQINSQLDTAKLRIRQIRCCRVTIVGRKYRNLYGWFERESKALSTEPNLEYREVELI